MQHALQHQTAPVKGANSAAQAASPAGNSGILPPKISYEYRWPRVVKQITWYDSADYYQEDRVGTSTAPTPQFVGGYMLLVNDNQEE
ncbi:MAG: hypothetical protein JRN62_03870 [Nitrososphaerota archaeon]|jgi:hypothetical protein|nr:hypothetical protein [Nitrososphaerota archaeon]MDG6948740.1 hypothetical protein [Nitrososphaerota archaeon]